MRSADWTKLSALTFLMASSPAFADQETIVLAPSSPWQLDYAEERCRLARLFGEEENKTIFWIDQTGPSSTFSWLVAGGALDQLGSTRNLDAAFGPGFAPFEVSSTHRSGDERRVFELDSFGKAVDGSGYKRGVEADGARTHALSLDDGKNIEFVEFHRKDRVVRLQTGDLSKGFEALNKCAADLFAFWGVEPDIQSHVAQIAKPLNMQKVAQRVQRHYPRKAESRGEDAILTLKLLIDEEGSVEKCITIKKTKAENFDEYACEVFVEYARYEPARNEAGEAVKSLYSTNVVYQTF